MRYYPVLALLLCALPAQRAAAQSAGDDFFAYANADWLRATTIPDGLNRWGVRQELEALTRRQIMSVLDVAATAPVGTAARRVADFRASWLNEDAIEARGLAPLRPLFDSIARLRDKTELARLLGRSIGADVDPLNWGIYESSRVVGLSIEPGIAGERTYPVFLLQGGLGLPDREYYLGDEPRMQALRTQYQAYVSRLLELAGFTRAGHRAEAVLALEVALARSHDPHTTSANDHNADHRWARADFAREAPGLDWTAFLDAAGLARQDTLGVWQPHAMTGLAALVAATPLDTWKDYLRAHLLEEEAEVLPRAFASQSLALRSAVSGQAPPARAQLALDATQRWMGDAVGRLYAERFFSAEQKARVREIVSNVTQVFSLHVQSAEWLSPATRALALAKLRALYVGIGYPERWDDDELAVDPSDAFGNHRRALARNHSVALSRLGRPVDLSQWWIAPQVPGAILVFQQNAYDFAAGLLQAPKFDATSDAAAYGSIGAVIGHDVSHYVDLLGADYDTAFAERRWWTAEDVAHFEAAAQPLVAQFNGLGVNGAASRSENVADLGGLIAAFHAWRRSLGARAADTARVRQGDREFFLAWARAWRVQLRPEALRAQAATSDHAPEPFRVNTVRNIDAWYEAFDVRPGQAMYLPPSARVHVW